MSTAREAWRGFWAGAAPSCLPNAPAALSARLAELWSGFARALPEGAAVLDLACGSGAVGAALVAARPGLRVTGVDLAEVRGSPAPGVRLAGGVALEALPASLGCFDALTSQFGIEYADVARAVPAATALCRRPAALCFACHHAGGPILAANRARSDAIGWMVEESGVVQALGRLVRGPLAGAAIATAAERQLALALGASPPASVAGELAAAMQALAALAAAGRREEAAQGLDDLRARAGAERARLADLERAALDRGGVERLAGALAGAGWSVEAPTELREAAAAEPFAWAVRARLA